MKIIDCRWDAAAPFILGKQQFFYATAIQAQWNKTPLVAQDKLSIGSRYTVRGFDGEQSLFGERGFYWQNISAIGIFYPNHQFYLSVRTMAYPRKCTIRIGHAADGCSGRLQRRA